MADERPDDRSEFDRFVEEVWADHEAGHLRALAEYRARYPGAESRAVESEYRAVCESFAEPVAPPVRGVGLAGHGEQRPPRHLGDYELAEWLGGGGFGEVWRARHPVLGEVALKLILPKWLDNAEVLGRFRREMRLARNLQHPNVVRVLDAGAIDGRHYIASELMARGSLLDLLRLEVRLPEPSVLEILRDVLSGLAALQAHGPGWIHRDIKPANILFGPDGVAKLGDFGLVRSMAEDSTVFTSTGRLVGTPRYAAPEQLEGLRELDAGCDLYALAITAFHCIAGRPPFEGSTPETIRQHLRGPIPDLRQCHSEVSGDLAALLAKLMAKEPGARGTVEEAVGAVADLASQARAGAAGEPERGLGAVPAMEDVGISSTEYAGAATEMIVLLGETEALTEMSPPEPSLTEAALLARRSAPAGPEPQETERPRPAVAGLLLHRGDRAIRLHLHGGGMLKAGRLGEGVGLTPRLRLPLDAETLSPESLRWLSSTHLALTVRGGEALIEDLASSNGTWVNGARLEALQPRVLRRRNEVVLAGKLRLLVSVVPPSGSPVPGRGRRQEEATAAPAVLIEQRDTKRPVVHVLLPGRLALVSGTELFHHEGSFWIQGGASGPGRWQPLTAGLRIETAEGSIEVTAS